MKYSAIFWAFVVGAIIWSPVMYMYCAQKSKFDTFNGNHTFLVYYTSIPDTLQLSGSYELTSHRGTNQIYRIECDKLSPKCMLSTTAPIKHIFNK